GQGTGLTIQFSDKPVPLPAVKVTDLDGRALSSADWQGKVILINFWATWCGPCRAEIPEFVKMQERYRDHLVIVGLSVDEGSPDAVKAFARELGVNYPVLDGNGRDDVEDAYGPMWGLPTSVIIGRDGRVVKRQTGAASKAQFNAIIQPLL
ncbi:MAG: redoxin domain-containing protein, partial [Luteitalea sp.]|nr:redoxin domain-containing protein [Luteitalea sp.]